MREYHFRQICEAKTGRASGLRVSRSPPKMNTSLLVIPGRTRASLLACFASAGVLLSAGCMTAGQHRDAVQDNSPAALSAGKVQREIRVGMAGSQVAEALGAPNIVTTDENRREVWVYDKVSTEISYSKSEGGLSALILKGWSSAAGGLGGSGSQAAGAESHSQRTLTVVIKFDENKLVRDFSYHQSSF